MGLLGLEERPSMEAGQRLSFAIIAPGRTIVVGNHKLFYDIDLGDNHDSAETPGGADLPHFWG